MFPAIYPGAAPFAPVTARNRVKTERLIVDPTQPDPAALRHAADVLRRGGLVAFPTETVYGLGANSLDASAVERIFAAKGRPATNPLIVHVCDEAMIGQVAAAWTDRAAQLAARFWPGPLTLVLPKHDRLPTVVTAGGPTVAVRRPDHAVAAGLLAEAALPIAAPSANRSTQLSPTRAEHVLKGLDGRIDLILDGGPTSGGMESTVLDLTTDPPRLLRAGLITPGQISDDLGLPLSAAAQTDDLPGPARSPGLQSRHYAPCVPLELADDDGWSRVEQLAADGRVVGWVAFDVPATGIMHHVRAVFMPHEPTAYAAALYAELHALEDAGVAAIVVARPPRGDAWLVVHDRLNRAAARE